MPKKQFNKISFNNFKPFSEKMQTFTKKPITLIYGPNSIGKSSLLHSMLNLEYATEKYNMLQGNIDLKQSNFAGDKLDLGGFINYIHKRDTTKHICYRVELNNTEDMAKILSPYYSKVKHLILEAQQIGDYELKQQDTNIYGVIIKRIQNYRQKNNTFYLASIDKVYYQNTVNDLIKEKFIKNNNLLKSKEDIDLIFEKCLNSKETFEDITYRNDKKPLDSLDKILLLLLDNTQVNDKYFNVFESINPEDEKLDLSLVLDEIDLYSYLSNIKSITLESELYADPPKKIKIKNKFYIDGELIFSFFIDDFQIYFEILKNNQLIQQLYKGNKENWNKFSLNFSEDCRIIENSFFDLFINRLTEQKDMKRKNQNEDYYKNIFLRLVNNAFLENKHKNIQYFGPLRWFPNRDDLLQIHSNKYGNNQKGIIDSTEQKRKMHIKILKKYNNLPSFIKESYLLTKLYLYTANLYYFPKWISTYISNVYNSPAILDANNIMLYRSNKHVRTTQGAKTTEQMWMALLNSEEAQSEINEWLGDEKKLKSTYMLGPLEYVKKNTILKRILSGEKEEKIQELAFIDLQSETQVFPKDMGLGISQVLPVLISCKTQNDTKIFLEQPELHLHPAIQAELADEFIQSYKKNNNEFMIETHSEHLLLRMMKRMRHTAEGRIDKDDVLALTPDDVCLLYVDSDGENTFVNELELDDDGTLLDIWPNGFFEEGYNERFD